MTGAWMKRDRWPVSHYVHAARAVIVGASREVTSITACGRHVTVDGRLQQEPTGIDTVDRCTRCRGKVGGAA